jgi:hypothetical protein
MHIDMGRREGKKNLRKTGGVRRENTQENATAW